MSNLATLNRNGRKAGVPNKYTGSIKEMVERALTKAGGVEYLTEQAHANPVAFMGLLGRIMPLQVQGDSNSVVSLFAAHLLAATAVSEQLHSQPSEPPTINGNVEQAPASLLDAPIPKE